MYTTFINALVYYEDQKGIILSFVKKNPARCSAINEGTYRLLPFN